MKLNDVLDVENTIVLRLVMGTESFQDSYTRRWLVLRGEINVIRIATYADLSWNNF